MTENSNRLKPVLPRHSACGMLGSQGWLLADAAAEASYDRERSLALWLFK